MIVNSTHYERKVNLSDSTPTASSLTNSNKLVFNFTQLAEVIQTYIIIDFFQVTDILSLKLTSQKMCKKIESLNHPSGFNLSAEGLSYLHQFQEDEAFTTFQKSQWRVLSIFEKRQLDIIKHNRFASCIKMLNFYEVCDLTPSDSSVLSHCPNLRILDFRVHNPNFPDHFLPKYCDTYNALFRNLVNHCPDLQSITTNITPLHAEESFVKLSQCKKLTQLGFLNLQGYSLGLLASREWPYLEHIELFKFSSNSQDTISLWKKFVDKSPKLQNILYHGKEITNHFPVKEINQYIRQRNKSLIPSCT